MARPDPLELLALAESIAADAAALLRRGSDHVHEVETKTTLTDMVTATDRASERLIVGRILDARPDDAILGEEGTIHPGTSGVRWVVDPLDGTTNYVHGLPVFAVSIALERAGEVVLGVVHDPIREETFVAERGHGARMGDEPIKVSDTDGLVRALVATGFPYDRADVPAALNLFGRFSMLAQGMRRLGSAALDLCYVAAGRLDAYYERGVHAWDVAAGGIILEEAGGRITDYRGEPFELEAGELVASNGSLHPALVELTSRHPD